MKDLGIGNFEISFNIYKNEILFSENGLDIRTEIGCNGGKWGGVFNGSTKIQGDGSPLTMIDLKYKTEKEAIDKLLENIKKWFDNIVIDEHKYKKYEDVIFFRKIQMDLFE